MNAGQPSMDSGMPMMAAPQLPARVFINYAHANQSTADWLAEELKKAGAVVWIDRAKIRGGDAWAQKLDHGLYISQFVISVVTQASASAERRWVREEQQRAEFLGKQIIPCLFEDADAFFANTSMPPLLAPLHAIKFHDQREAGLLELIHLLRSRMRRLGKPFPGEAKGLEASFVGRQKDLKTLTGLIDNELTLPTGRKTVGIVAGGGIGKTMLAEELVRRLAPNYPGGVLIEYRGDSARPATLVMHDWADRADQPLARDYGPDEGRAMATEIRGRLDGYGELLLLVDDVAGDDVSQTRLLLEAMPAHATRIITTRSHDVVTGLAAHVYELDLFDGPDGIDLLKSRLRELFSSRFESNEAFEAEVAKYTEDLAHFVEAVGRHPLALDLGIRTCDGLDEIPEKVAYLVAGLERGIDDFKSFTFDAADRNQSLAASLEVSREMLARIDEVQDSDWERRFAMLGVFPDGARMSKAMILATWDDDDSTRDDGERALQGLLRRAMLRRESGGRYYNHPVVRAYAVGLLKENPDRLIDVADRYGRWVIQEANQVFAGPPEEWHRHSLLADHLQHLSENLIGELKKEIGPLEPFAVPAPLDDAGKARLSEVDSVTMMLAMDLADSVKEYVIRRPEWGDAGAHCLRLGLVAARGLNSAQSEVEFLKRLGGAFTKPQPNLAAKYFAQALLLARELGDSAQVGDILSYFGELERTRGKPQVALRLLGEALELHRKAGNSSMEAKTLKYLGEVYWRMSEYAEALERYHLAEQIYNTVGHVSGQADIFNKIGSVEFNRGDHKTAIEWFTKAIELHEQVGNRSMVAEDHNDMGAAFRYQGNKEGAKDLFETALAMHVELGNRRLESISRSNLSGVLSDMGRYDRALVEAKTAKSVAQEVGDPVPLIWAYCWEGSALEGLGRYDESETAFKSALAEVRQIDNPRGLAGVLGMYGSLLKRFPERQPDAVTLASEAVKVMEKRDLAQAFGGRTLAQMVELRDALS